MLFPFSSFSSASAVPQDNFLPVRASVNLHNNEERNGDCFAAAPEARRAFGIARELAG